MKRPKKMPEGKRFKPGNCANPHGRPRSATFAGAMRQLLAEVGPNGQTTAEALVAVCMKKALKGSPRHIALALDYVESKPKQGLEISGPEGGPLQLAALSTAELHERVTRLRGAALADPLHPEGLGTRSANIAEKTGIAEQPGSAPVAALPEPAEPEKSPFEGISVQAQETLLRNMQRNRYLMNPNGK